MSCPASLDARSNNSNGVLPIFSVIMSIGYEYM
jgi:hypothetical protein